MIIIDVQFVGPWQALKVSVGWFSTRAQGVTTQEWSGYLQGVNVLISYRICTKYVKVFKLNPCAMLDNASNFNHCAIAW